MTDCIVKKLNLADFGREELDIAETEMFGLMALRSEYGESKPLKVVRIWAKTNLSINAQKFTATLAARQIRMAGSVGSMPI